MNLKNIINAGKLTGTALALAAITSACSATWAGKNTQGEPIIFRANASPYVLGEIINAVSDVPEKKGSVVRHNNPEVADYLARQKNKERETPQGEITMNCYICTEFVVPSDPNNDYIINGVGNEFSVGKPFYTILEISNAGGKRAKFMLYSPDNGEKLVIPEQEIGSNQEKLYISFTIKGEADGKAIWEVDGKTCESDFKVIAGGRR